MAHHVVPPAKHVVGVGAAKTPPGGSRAASPVLGGGGGGGGGGKPPPPAMPDTLGAALGNMGNLNPASTMSDAEENACLILIEHGRYKTLSHLAGLAVGAVPMRTILAAAVQYFSHTKDEDVQKGVLSWFYTITSELHADEDDKKEAAARAAGKTVRRGVKTSGAHVYDPKAPNLPDSKRNVYSALGVYG